MEAPDSLVLQSHRNPDGAGVGCFPSDGEPVLEKEALPAWEDPVFARAARELTGTTFVAHVRYATTGGLTTANTHPFLQQGRLFAHNGEVAGLDLLDARLSGLGTRSLVDGETDSERVFALITAEIDAHSGDVGAGLVAAVRWIAGQLPVYALNLVLITATELWALRYPAADELYVLERPAGGTGTTRRLEGRSTRISARSAGLARRSATIVATERLDDDPGWRLLEPGELIRVDADLNLTSSTPLDPPKDQLARPSSGLDR